MRVVGCVTTLLLLVGLVVAGMAFFALADPRVRVIIEALR